MRPFQTAALLAATALTALAADPVEFQVGAFAFDRPEAWAWVASTSPMRKAQMSVTGPGGAVGDVVFFHFGPGQGGSVRANIDRWIGQFENAEGTATSTEDIEGRAIHFVSTRGTFLSGMPGTPATPLEGFALRGAIIESPGGDVFVKFTGPAAVVDANTEAFDKMVRTARPVR